jgi:dihydroneopterin aldolase
MGTIKIDQIKVDCIIGVYDTERINKQRLYIDIELDYDSTNACQTDYLKYAIDYFQITEDIHEFVSQSSYQLIEALTSAIADRILLNDLIENTQVTVSKPEALSKANTVSFSLLKKQNS